MIFESVWIWIIFHVVRNRQWETLIEIRSSLLGTSSQVVSLILQFLQIRTTKFLRAELGSLMSKGMDIGQTCKRYRPLFDEYVTVGNKSSEVKLPLRSKRHHQVIALG